MASEGKPDMDAVLNFMAVTDSTQDVAERLLEASQGDLDAAVALFFDDGGAAGGSEEGEAVPAEAAAAAGAGGGAAAGGAAEALASVEDILGQAESAAKSEEEDARWLGGARLGDGSPSAASAGQAEADEDPNAPKRKSRTVMLLFFADGFCVDEEVDSKKEEAEAEAAAAKAAAKPKPAPRRGGMVTLDDFKRSSGGGRGGMGKMPKIPKLPPLRSYDTPESKAFLAQLRTSGVPEELRRRDEATGLPITLSIGVEDLRPRTYKELSAAIADFEKMAKEEGGEEAAAPAAPSASATLFAGAGHTLSSSSSAAGAGASSAAASGGAASGGAGADPALLALIDAAPAPVVDESRPATTLQLRLSNGMRAKVKLNLDHTVADLWRHVAAQMGRDAFAAASGHELSAGFPPKPLLDPSVTLKAADLANAAVSHRSK